MELIVLLLLVFTIVREWFWVQREKKYINAIIAKDYTEFKALELKPEKKEVKPKDNIVPLDELSDEEFNKII